jgi:hypothetical protein
VPNTVSPTTDRPDVQSVASDTSIGGYRDGVMAIQQDDDEGAEMRLPKLMERVRAAEQQALVKRGIALLTLHPGGPQHALQ